MSAIRGCNGFARLHRILHLKFNVCVNVPNRALSLAPADMITRQSPANPESEDRSSPPFPRRRQAPLVPLPDPRATFQAVITKRTAAALAWDSGPNSRGSSFGDSFCRRYSVSPERFEIEMMRRCLSRRARWFRPLLELFAEHHFSLDRFFVRSIGRVRTAAEFRAEVQAFRDHPSNRRWARRSMKLRLSIWRIWDVADEILPYLQPAQPTAPLPGPSHLN